MRNGFNGLIVEGVSGGPTAPAGWAAVALALLATAPVGWASADVARAEIADAEAGTSAPPTIAGYLERVAVAGVVLEAKLDTGADTSSLDARDVTVHADGVRGRVRFRLGDGGAEATARVLEAPIVRVTRIRRAGAGRQRRYVVRLPLCLGGRRQDAEFTLTDRRGLDVPVLIGRAALVGRHVVDPARTHLTVPADGTPSCPAG
jgi:hypothetical protein